MSRSTHAAAQLTERISKHMPHAQHLIWRADQMAVYQAATLPSGFSRLDQELPQAGWPSACLIELLVQQPGMGELQLLKPALRHIAQHGRIALIQPPHLPQIAAFNAWGIAIENLLWIKTQRSADALWAAEQILRHGCCGAVLLWQTHVHTNALRRLHLAVQATDTAFWMIRPLALGADASPASLRLALRPDLGGVQVDVIKRRGPRLAAPFYLALPDMPFSTEVLKKVPKVPSCVYG